MTTEYRMFIGLTDRAGKPVNREAVIDTFAKGVKSFTVQSATGFYQGVREESLVFTFINTAYPDSAVGPLWKSLAEELAATFNQTSILITKQEIVSESVYNPTIGISALFE